jgi:hypothetical protein
MVDLKFVDLLGTWQHCSFPIDVLDEDTFKEGLGGVLSIAIMPFILFWVIAKIFPVFAETPNELRS